MASPLIGPGFDRVETGAFMLPVGVASVPEVGAPFEELASTVQDTVEDLKPANWFQKLKLAIGATVVAAEVTPVNEAMRLSAVGAVAASTGSPLLSALTMAGSTLAIEGAAAVAAAPLLDHESANGVIDKVKTKLEKLGVEKEKDISPVIKVTSTVFGGSAVGMLVEKYDNPDIDKKSLRSFGLRASLGLAALTSIFGLPGPAAVEFVSNNPGPTTVVAGGLTAWFSRKKIAGLFTKNHIDASESEAAGLWIDSDKHGLSYGIVEDPTLRAQANELEQRVWDENEYGNLEEEGYTEYFDQSLVIAAYEKGECIGMTRMFRDTEQQPPFVKSMPYYDEKTREWLSKGYRNGEIEELGTAAVDEKFRHKDVNSRLWRIAYRDARERGVKYWGIVMEPERVESMNRRFAFNFEQVGEALDYQGGACAAHILDLDAVDKYMRRRKPLQWLWFVKLPLRSINK